MRRLHPAPQVDEPVTELAIEAWRKLLNDLPLYRGSPPRPLFFKKLEEVARLEFRTKGYEAFSLFELPRGERHHEVNYLLAKLQGIEEGTIFASDKELHALELEMRANKMLSHRGEAVRLNLNVRGKEAKEILAGWQGSRHTLRGNSTVVAASLEASSMEPIAGIKRGGKVMKSKMKG